MPSGTPVVRDRTKLERVVATSSLIIVSLVVLLIVLLLARAVLTGTRTGLGLHRRNKARPNRKVRTPVSAWEEAGRRMQVEPFEGDGGDRDQNGGDGGGDHGGDAPGGGDWRSGPGGDDTGDDLPPQRRST